MFKFILYFALGALTYHFLRGVRGRRNPRNRRMGRFDPAQIVDAEFRDLDAKEERKS